MSAFVRGRAETEEKGGGGRGRERERERERKRKRKREAEREGMCVCDRSFLQCDWSLLFMMGLCLYNWTLLEYVAGKQMLEKKQGKIPGKRPDKKLTENDLV